MIILSIILSILSGIAYRVGGMDKQTKHWIPVWMRHSWVRDYLCPVCALLPLIGSASWWFVLAYALSVAALSTYWDWLFKGVDNFWFAGLFCGVAFFPLYALGWQPILIRCAIISIGWGMICAWSDNDFVEEYSRGFIFSAATILFLL